MILTANYRLWLIIGPVVPIDTSPSVGRSPLGGARKVPTREGGLRNKKKKSEERVYYNAVEYIPVFCPHYFG